MNGVCEIPLSKGKVALVDEADLERVSQYRWSAYRNGKSDIWYARRYYQVNKQRYFQSLHHFILKTDARSIDHKNRNGLDCRRENLRPATHSQNMANRKMSILNTSGYRGVTRKRHDYPRPWEAKIKKDKRTQYLGCFATAMEAAKAYDSAARRIHGEFAVLNFPDKRREVVSKWNTYRIWRWIAGAWKETQITFRARSQQEAQGKADRFWRDAELSSGPISSMICVLDGERP